MAHRAHDNGCSADVRDPVLLDGCKDVVCNHLSETHVHTCNGRHRIGEEPAIQVEYGDCPKVNTVSVKRPLDDQVHALQVGAAVMQQYTLGICGGPAGVAPWVHAQLRETFRGFEARCVYSSRPYRHQRVLHINTCMTLHVEDIETKGFRKFPLQTPKAQKRQLLLARSFPKPLALKSLSCSEFLVHFGA